MSFEQPATPEKFSPRDHPEWIGRLFLIYPTSVDMVTFNNDDGTPKAPSEVVTADVAIVDLIDPQTGRPVILKGARIGGKALVPQIKPYASKHNTAAAGRLKQLPGQGAKNGAYVLDNFAPEDGPTLNAFDATDWRGTYQQPAPAVAAQPAQVAYQAPLGAGPTATPAAPTASPGAPWFASGDGPAVLGKLVANGIANAATLDEQTARMIATGLPG